MPYCWETLAGLVKILERRFRRRKALREFEKYYERARPLRRITILNTHDLIGGAERASYDLHVFLRSMGYESTLVVGGKLGDDVDVVPVRFLPIDSRFGQILREVLGITEIAYLSPFFTVLLNGYFRYCDVINLHNLHGRYWNLLTIPIIARRKPVIITLHDEFLLTGDCGYSYGCERWQKWCGRCPLAHSDKITRYPASGFDLSRFNILIKRSIFSAVTRQRIHVVSPSRWLAEKARRSPILGRFPISIIPYGIPLEIWKPMDQIKARNEIGLPPDSHVGFFSAVNLNDRRKGLDVIMDAIRRVRDRKNLHFLVVGNASDSFRELARGLSVRFLGFLSDKREIAKCISAADFTVVLSRADNLPYSGLESLACGRPLIGTRVGGIPEIVNHSDLGWLVPSPPQAEDVVEAMIQAISLPLEEKLLRFEKCRKAAEERYDVKRMALDYLQLMASLRQTSI